MTALAQIIVNAVCSIIMIIALLLLRASTMPATTHWVVVVVVHRAMGRQQTMVIVSQPQTIILRAGGRGFLALLDRSRQGAISGPPGVYFGRVG